MKIKIGPDAARYLAAAEGIPVPRPFHLRWVLPFFCGVTVRRWWFVWWAGWITTANGMFWWRIIEGDGWQRAAAATVVLLALPGILGPQAVTPVGVDLPSTGVALSAVALSATGQPHMIAAAVILVAWGSGIKETLPVWAAVWAWCPWLLIGLVPVAGRAFFTKPGPDPLGEEFQRIADHPIRTAFEHRNGRWRDAWLMVAPWGIGVLALIDPSPQVLVVLAVAHLQLLVATDTVRLVHHAAGPVIAAAAISHISTEWLWLFVVVHLFWWRKPERI